MKLPFFKFFPRDYRADPSIQGTSFAARGLYIEVKCLAWMNEANRGYLEVSGKPLTDPAQIARVTGGEAEETRRLLEELLTADVLCRDSRGCIFCPALVAEAQRSEIGRQFGLKGGNPALKTKGVNPTLNPPPYPGGLNSEGRRQKAEGRDQISPIPPTGDFSRFWDAYPRKVARQAAIKAFKAAISKTNIESMLKALATQKQSQQWQKDGGRFIPHPSSWLNGERWADVVSTQNAALPVHTTGEATNEL